MKSVRGAAVGRMLVIVGVLFVSASALALASKPHIGGLSARTKSHKFKKPGTKASVKPKCAHGKKPVSGGFDSKLTDLEGAAISASSASGKAWKTTGSFFDREGGAKDKLKGSIYCAKGVPKIKKKKKTKALGPQKAASLSAKCPKHYQAIAGGFKTSLDYQSFKGVIVNASHRVGKRKWQVHGLNIAFTGTKKVKLTTYAYCARGVKLATKSKSKPVSLDHPTINLKPKCKGRGTAVSGGFSSAIVSAGGTRDGNFIAASKLKGKHGWSVRASYVGGKGDTPVKETGYVYCTKKKK